MVATQLMPGQWVKPVIEQGVLPVHAQVSFAITITNLAKIFTGTNDCQTSGGPGSTNVLTLDYMDITGNFVSGSVLLFSSSFDTSLPTEIDIFNFANATVTGDGFQGSIAMTLCTRFGGTNSVTNHIQLRNASGHLSDIHSITTNRPAGAERSTGSGWES